MEWIFKGNKAFHGTDKLWAIAICIVIFLIVGLYSSKCGRRVYQSKRSR